MTAGRVAVVTGAARGIGRGIALVLGEAGATVYVTDRESRGHRYSELPGTVEDTAEQVSERGGRGIAVPLDHRDDLAVQALFERVGREHGGLDLLVANAAAGNDLAFASAPFWELSVEHWRNMFDVGVRSHLVAASFAAPPLIERRGLLVLTGYTDPDAEVLGNHVYYDLAMHATSRLAHSLAHDLRAHGVTALTVSPGFTRTEAIVAALGARPPGSDSVEFLAARSAHCWRIRGSSATRAARSPWRTSPRSTGSSTPGRRAERAWRARRPSVSPGLSTPSPSSRAIACSRSAAGTGWPPRWSASASSVGG